MTDLSNQTGLPDLGGSSFSDNCYRDAERERSVFILARSCVEIVLVLVYITLNVIIIVVVSASRRLHTVQHVFLVSLAVSDLITSCIFGTDLILEIYYQQTGQACDSLVLFKCFRAFIAPFGMLSSQLNHLLISGDRWLYIARPFWHQRIVTSRTTAYSLILVWVISGAVNFNVLADKCSLEFLSARLNVGVISAALHFFLSLAMFSIYSHIAFIVRRQIRSINTTRPVGAIPRGSQSQTSVRTSWKNIRMPVTVFGTFFLLVTPAVCTDIYTYCTKSHFFDTPLGQIVTLFWLGHCSLNFFVYSAQDRVFRDVLQQDMLKAGALLCRKQVRPVS
jgi:hypothetical protein